MRQDLKPYLSYRDSGTKWLGNIPRPWECLSLASLSLPRVERNPGNLGLLSVFLDRGVIPYAEGGGQVHAPSFDLSNYQLVRVGDFVLNNQQAWRGSVGVSQYEGIISPAYIVLKLSRSLEPVFANYMLRSPALVSQFVVASRGVGDIQRQLHMPSLRKVRVPVPPHQEQAAIARFLGHFDRRSRRYVRAKKKLIALLKEQRQAIITFSVTRGLDTLVQHLQELGSAPDFLVSATWSVARLGTIARIRSEKNRPELDLLSVFLGRGVIRYGEGSGQVHKPSLDLSGYQVVYPGDLVLNNQQAWRGSVGVSSQLGIVSPAYVVMELGESLDSRFANYLFQSRTMVAQFVTSSKGVGDIQRDVHAPWLKNIRVPFPRREEQAAIANHLDRELADINHQLALFEREIELLDEFRVRLIADVVTGKLDVSEAAARLPEEAEESESLRESEPIAEDGEEAAELNDTPEEAVA